MTPISLIDLEEDRTLKACCGRWNARSKSQGPYAVTLPANWSMVMSPFK